MVACRLRTEDPAVDGVVFDMVRSPFDRLRVLTEPA
jgi:hypothetical protein